VSIFVRTGATAADAKDTPLSKEDSDTVDALIAESNGYKAQIAQLEKSNEQKMQIAQGLDGAEASRGAQVRPEITQVKPAIENDPKHGFANFGEFAMSVANAAKHPGAMDPRLNVGAAVTTYGNEQSGVDGGYLVPAEFSSTIYEHSLDEDAFLPLTDNNVVSGNSMSFPRDETTPWGTNGVRAYWESEAGAATQTKPVLGYDTLRLNKLMALVPVSDELLEDTTALESYIGKKTASSIRWKTNNAIIEGNGAGKPLGITNSASPIVSVAKESSQTADTINATNVAKMYGRCTNPTRGTWLINHDAFPQLMVMSISNQPIWTPPVEGFKSAPGGLLLGRPVIITQHCETLGDQGDIYFVDFQDYVTLSKAGGVQTATSIHFFFDQAVTAFRAVFRVAGQPWATSSVTANNGSNALSPFVRLDARA
jgi:HK97 family phage major capsid protein